MGTHTKSGLVTMAVIIVACLLTPQSASATTRTSGPYDEVATDRHVACDEPVTCTTDEDADAASGILRTGVRIDAHQHPIEVGSGDVFSDADLFERVVAPRAARSAQVTVDVDVLDAAAEENGATEGDDGGRSYLRVSLSGSPGWSWDAEYVVLADSNGGPGTGRGPQTLALSLGDVADAELRMVEVTVSLGSYATIGCITSGGCPPEWQVDPATGSVGYPARGAAASAAVRVTAMRVRWSDDPAGPSEGTPTAVDESLADCGGSVVCEQTGSADPATGVVTSTTRVAGTGNGVADGSGWIEHRRGLAYERTLPTRRNGSRAATVDAVDVEETRWGPVGQDDGTRTILYAWAWDGAQAMGHTYVELTDDLAGTQQRLTFDVVPYGGTTEVRDLRIELGVYTVAELSNRCCVPTSVEPMERGVSSVATLRIDSVRVVSLG